ncbi:hypothetical protein B566_EDAN016621 [Ephemera danica]|nr:hypothetical protein B566_EDAN016621 [Ephemera danica]
MKKAALEDVARYGCRASFQVYRAGLLLRTCVEGRHTEDAHVVVTRLCAARAATSRESPSSSLLYVAEIIERRRLSNGPGKNGIFFDSVIHAREWIGPSTVMYAINELTENLAANQAMLDNTDFYFLLDRFWGITRSPNNGSICIGTDGNRNFDNHWGVIYKFLGY